MTCIKTGCHVQLIPYGEWLYGDGFEFVVDEETELAVFVFRIVQRRMKPIAARKHFSIRGFEQWFDERKTSFLSPSTMIVRAHNVENFGYEGVPIDV